MMDFALFITLMVTGINIMIILCYKCKVYHTFLQTFRTNNPVGWWISEKLDGVRAYWNGR